MTEALAEARAEPKTAEADLRRLDEQTADLASELEGVIAAAQDAIARAPPARPLSTPPRQRVVGDARAADPPPGHNAVDDAR